MHHPQQVHTNEVCIPRPRVTPGSPDSQASTIDRRSEAWCRLEKFIKYWRGGDTATPFTPLYHQPLVQVHLDSHGQLRNLIVARFA